MPKDLLTELENVASESLRERKVSEQSPRWFELCLVLSVAFGNSILASIFFLRGGPARVGPEGAYRWTLMIVSESAALLLLAYVLHRRGMRIRDLGLRWSFGELGRGLLLALVAYAAVAVGYALLHWVQRILSLGGSGASPWGETFRHPSVVMVAALLLNPFFEELIVRAYLMTEVRELTGSSTLAVAASTALQISYHLYYGWTGALALGFQFLVMSIYYAKSRRAMPLIVAHGIFDLLALV